jgi:hypothetical protein
VNGPVQLVFAHDPLGAAMYRKRPVAPAGMDVVCMLADGSLVSASQLGKLGNYRRRYDVNTADHFHSEVITLPARNDAFDFQGSMDIGWRVTDAVTVVERNVSDGLALVRSTLLTQMRQISRGYDVEQCAAADEKINRRLGGASISLPEGITVHRFAVHLTLDAQTREYLQKSRNHVYEEDLDQRRLEATRRALAGDNALLVMHLMNNRDDTASVIDLLAKDRNTSEQRRIDLFRELLTKGVIQDADLDELTRALVKQNTTAVLGYPAGAPQVGPSSISLAPSTVVHPTQQQTALTAEPERTAAQHTPVPNTSTGGVAAWKSVGKDRT